MSPRTGGRLAPAFDWAFRNRQTGGITIGQWPNLPLWLFLAATVLGWLLGRSDAAAWLTLAGRIALVWWALDEVLRGVNPWRRFLGGIALAGLAAIVLV